MALVSLKTFTVYGNVQEVAVSNIIMSLKILLTHVHITPVKRLVADLGFLLVVDKSLSKHQVVKPRSMMV